MRICVILVSCYSFKLSKTASTSDFLTRYHGNLPWNAVCWHESKFSLGGLTDYLLRPLITRRKHLRLSIDACPALDWGLVRLFIVPTLCWSWRQISQLHWGVGELNTLRQALQWNPHLGPTSYSFSPSLPQPLTGCLGSQTCRAKPLRVGSWQAAFQRQVWAQNPVF